jgi:hypothetical protein
MTFVKRHCLTRPILPQGFFSKKIFGKKTGLISLENQALKPA